MDKKEIITVLEEWNFWSRPLVETFPRYKYEHAIAQKIDAGLSKKVSFEVGKGRGSLLENIVFLELLRDNKEIYYYRTGQGYEVDFLIKDGEKITHLIQVTESLKDEKIIKRETRALVKAKEELKYADKARLLILTMGEAPSTLESCNEIEMQNIMEFMCLR